MNLRFEDIGKVYRASDSQSRAKPSNSFGIRYRKDQKYLHFFKNKEDMNDMRMLYLKNGKEYYFCTFDIPYRILLIGKGHGYYYGYGYDTYPLPETKREYIVNAKNFSPKWLIDAQLDEYKHNYIENSKAEKDKGDDEFDSRGWEF